MTTPTTTPSLLLRDSDVAQLLGIGKSTVWREAKEGRLPSPIKIGGTTRWVRAQIIAWIDAAAAASQPTTA